MVLRDIMTRNVETITADDDLEQAARRMRDRQVGALPVWDGRRVVGILTDRDITVRATADGRSPRQVKVRAVMTPVPVCCYEDQDLRAAARLMEENQIRRVPILGRDGRLVGILSLADLAVRQQDPLLPAAVLHHISTAAAPEREHN